MTNPMLNNEIGNTEVILWQYDQAWNLIRLIDNWNGWAKAACQDFWDRFWGDNESFKNGTFFIDSADTFGLNVWGNLLGIPRPTIRIPVESDLDEGGVDYVTIPSDESDSARFDEYGYDADGYRVSEVTKDGWKVVTIKNTLYRGLLKGRFFMMCHTPTVPNYNKFLAILFGVRDSISGKTKREGIFDESGRVKEVQWTYSGGGNPEVQSFLDAYADSLRLIVHKYPRSWTIDVEGYDTSKYLVYSFGKIILPESTEIPRTISFPVDLFIDEDSDPVRIGVFEATRNVEDIFVYESRNTALDFMDMTMGFTFPANATTEEAYLIFQHYDIVYPFPAGIRYAGEFINDELVIGLNTESQNPTSDNNQNYKNFVDGLVLAEDLDINGNPNGGIFSNTDRANYLVPATVTGKACLVKIDLSESVTAEENASSEAFDVEIAFKSLNMAKRQAVWIDWGNGFSGYNYLPAGNNEYISFGTKYTTSGMYPIMILFDSAKVEMGEVSCLNPNAQYVKDYLLNARGEV